MKKILILLFIIVLSIVVGSLYGIINDQLTYTISPEYYTKFKFMQFGLGTESTSASPRSAVSLVGVMATWWVGLIIGISLGLVGLIHQNYKQMFTNTMKAIGIAVCTAFVAGLMGLAYGKLYLAKIGVDWWIPADTVDIDSFIAVGSMHNFGYVGGLIGLVAGIVYTLAKKQMKAM